MTGRRWVSGALRRLGEVRAVSTAWIRPACTVDAGASESLTVPLTQERRSPPSSMRHGEHGDADHNQEPARDFDHSVNTFLDPRAPASPQAREHPPLF